MPAPPSQPSPPSPSLASYVKSAPSSDGEKRAPPPPPPMREVCLPFAAPRYCGDFAIHIRRDGTWCYQGSPIRRQALCHLFASVLHKDADGQHWLITPAERGRITVELAPFLVSQCRYTHGALQLKTTLDDWTTVDDDHPVFMAQRKPQPPQSFPQTPQEIPQQKTPHDLPETSEDMLPYCRINPQRRLDALIARSVFYELAERAEYDEKKKLFFIRSGKARFSLRPSHPTSK